MTRLSSLLRIGLFGIASVTSCCGSNLPWEVTNDLFISDFGGDQLLIYTADGTFRGDLTASGLNGPHGIAMQPDGSFFVASQLSNEIFSFDSDHQFVSRFGHASLDAPTGVAIGPTGELFVSGFNSDQISVFDMSGNFQRSFTGGRMNGPNGIAFDSVGNIFVTSYHSASLIKFDASENFIDSFAIPADSRGGVTFPSGIARDENDILHITSSLRDTIVKADTNGNFLGELTSRSDNPVGIAFSGNGHLFSIWPHFHFSDTGVAFDPGGNVVQRFTVSGSGNYTGMAFVPGPYPFDLACDFTSDGQCNLDDINLLSANFGGPLTFDLNGDATVDIADSLEWFASASSPDNQHGGGTRTFRIGDVNLDGNVSSADLGLLLNNFGCTSTCFETSDRNYSIGDLDGDDDVDSFDLSLVLNNFGFSAAVSAVPEPKVNVMLMLCVLGFLASFRRR